MHTSTYYSKASGQGGVPVPKVSVVVPACNSAAYLDECLDSLEAQTLGALQVILVDDGSTDGTLRMMRQRAQRRPGLYTVLHKDNGGQASARNIGLRSCTGEYVGFLDSDDYADADMFRRMYDKATISNADMVSCGIIGFRDGQDGCRIFDGKPQLPAEGRTVADLYRVPQVQPCIHLLRRAIIVDHDITFPELRAFEDIAFHLMAIAAVGRVSQVRQPCVKRRWRKASTVSTVTKRQVLQALPSLQCALDYYDAGVLSAERRQLLELASLRLLLCSTLGRANLVPDARDRAESVDAVLSFVETRFPERAGNPYLKGALGWYLKHAGRGTAAMSGPVFAARQKRMAHL